jgi:hypothetical protein
VLASNLPRVEGDALLVADSSPRSDAVFPGDDGDPHRFALGRVTQDQVPVDQTGERFVEACATLEETTAMRESGHRNEVALEKTLAVEGDAAHERLRRVGMGDQQRGVYGVVARMLLEGSNDGS